MPVEVKHRLRLTDQEDVCHALVSFHIAVTKCGGYKDGYKSAAAAHAAPLSPNTKTQNAHEDDFSYLVVLLIRNFIVFFGNCQTSVQSPGKSFFFILTQVTDLKTLPGC